MLNLLRGGCVSAHEKTLQKKNQPESAASDRARTDSRSSARMPRVVNALWTAHEHFGEVGPIVDLIVSGPWTLADTGMKWALVEIVERESLSRVHLTVCCVESNLLCS